jgi:hypothetical protein
MSQMAQVPNCMPCISEKEQKKKNEQDAKDLKAAINILVKHNCYDEKVMIVMGGLLTRLIHLQGPLK